MCMHALPCAYAVVLYCALGVYRMRRTVIIQHYTVRMYKGVVVFARHATILTATATAHSPV
jgi:hypothetical protein